MSALRITFNDAPVTIGLDSFHISGNIELQLGKATLLVGENGVGKTLLFGAIAAIFGKAPLSFVDKVGVDRVIVEPAAFAPNWIGIVRQEPQENYVSRCSADELILPWVNSSQTRETFEERLSSLLEQSNVGPDALTTPIAYLNAGRLQILGACASVSPTPEVLLLDEALARLDDNNAMRLASMICTNASNSYILASTHERKMYSRAFQECLGETYSVRRSENRVFIDRTETSPSEEGQSEWQTSELSRFVDTSRGDVLGKLNDPPADHVSIVPGTGEVVLSSVDVVSVFSRKTKARITSAHAIEIRRGVNLLVGQNGAGKTTFGKLLAGRIALNPAVKFFRNLYANGMLSPPEGSDIPSLRGFRRNGQSAFLPAEPSAWLSEELVQQEVSLFRYWNSTTQEDLQRFDIDPTHHVFELSYGQRRLLTLLSLPVELTLVILDEPFHGLSPKSAAGVAKLLEERLSSTWKAVIILTNRPIAVLDTLSDAWTGK